MIIPSANIFIMRLFLVLTAPLLLSGLRLLREDIQTPLEHISPPVITTDDESQFPTINADGTVSGPTEAPEDGTKVFKSGSPEDYSINPKIEPSVSDKGYNVAAVPGVCGGGINKKLAIVYGCTLT